MDEETREIMGKFVKRAENRAAESTRASKQKPPSSETIARIVRGRALRAGVPARFIDAELSHFGPEIRKRVEPFLRKEHESLSLFGPSGTGKTHLAAALLKARLAHQAHQELPELEPLETPVRESALFVTVPSLLFEIRATFAGTDATTEKDLVRRHCEAGLLVLDDLGAEKPSEWVNQTLYLILDRRYAELRKTIVTSNLTLDEIAEKLGDRLPSRLVGMGGILQLDGPDRRLER